MRARVAASPEATPAAVAAAGRTPLVGRGTPDTAVFAVIEVVPSADPIAGVRRRPGGCRGEVTVAVVGAGDGVASGVTGVGAGSAGFVGIGSSTTATTFQLGSGCVSSTVFSSPEISLTWEDSSGASSSFHPGLLFASDSACASACRTAGPSASDRRFSCAWFAAPFGSSCGCSGRVTISTHPPEVSCRELARLPGARVHGWQGRMCIVSGQPVNGQTRRIT